MPRAEPSCGRAGVRAAAIALVALVALAGRVHAAGPLIVNGAGTPLAWSAGVVTWNPDRGTLGTLSNAGAVDLVAGNFATWQAVPTAALAIDNGGSLPVDVTAANVGTFIGVCGDGVSPIVFDTDGSITDALLGLGASNTVLGFAGPECGTFAPPVITEASAVLNGKFIDGIESAGNPEISVAAFGAVFLHEFGHYLNLDHSQINLVEAFDHDSSNDDAIATMFPFLVNGTEAASLARDDQVAISMIYPAAALADAFGRVTGSVLRSDGVTPFQGAYVIARNVADPRRDAIGYASGARFFPGASGGPPASGLRGFYEIPGLAPGAQYTIEVEPIYPGFTGGSGVGPFSTPVPLPGPAEFWNGPDEAGSDPPDDPDAPGTPITAAAGVTVSGVDIVLNAILPPANDACADATAIAAFPFDDAEHTAGASRGAGDPIQRCTPGTATANANSVWYRFTAPAGGTVTVSTAGSDYDTVLSAYTGTCDTLASVACDDDVASGTDLTSAIGFAVSAGTTYLIEVTQYGSSGGGALVVAAAFTPGTPSGCDLPAPGVCVPGTGRTTTECVTEWLVEPVPPVERSRLVRRNAPAGRVVCHDGDTSCDFDGSGKDGACTFHVAVCVNNHDPRAAAAGCTPTSLASYLVRQPRAIRPRDAFDAANGAALRAAVASLTTPGGIVSGGLVSFVPPAASTAGCTPFQDIRIPVGTRTLRASARTAGGAVDTDQLSLRCLP